MSFITRNTVDSGKAPAPAALMKRERDASQFDPREMNVFLEGSKERSELNQTLIQQLERDPILSTTPKYFEATKEQQREESAVRIARLSRYLEQDSVEVGERRMSLFAIFDPQVNTRLLINLGLFLSCIRGNGTFEQYDYWRNYKETIKVKHMYGCFAMTELAHGSNVPGLETTAEFDKATDEFIINTPHIGATKWWIGGAAHSASHAAVYARLRVDGEDYGVKTFVVPLRDSNHDLMPGVTTGDIGAKMGRDGIDNGWIQFSSVRIPRFFMLQKFCKVSRDGDVVLPPLEQLSYSALLGGRVQMVADSYRIAAKSVTIALRYAIGRQQFSNPALTKEGECQLIDYSLHQRRLFPLLAQAYVYSSAALKVEEVIQHTLDSLDKAVADEDMNGIMSGVDSMKSLFVDSSSLKSTCTWGTAEAIDNCRQACGGHGYSSYSSFGKTYNDWVVQCTWEGDNTVLAISITKPLIKSIIGVLDKGQKVSGSISFLNDAKKYINDDNVITSLDDLTDLTKVVKAIEVLIIRLLNQASAVVKAENGNYDAVGTDMVTISKLKAQQFILNEFNQRVKYFDNEKLKPYLISLGKIYTATMVIERFAGEFLAFNILPTKLVTQLSSKVVPVILKEIRPHVAALTDSFLFSDMLINSALGSYNGDIYENYFGTVKANNPPSVTKAPYSAAFEANLGRLPLEARQRYEISQEAAKKLSS